MSGSALKFEAAGEVEPGVAALVAGDQLSQGCEHWFPVGLGERRFQATARWQKGRGFGGGARGHDGPRPRGHHGPLRWTMWRQQVRHDVSDQDARGDDGYQRYAMHA
jgi:hypothetical protein